MLTTDGGHSRELGPLVTITLRQLFFSVWVSLSIKLSRFPTRPNASRNLVSAFWYASISADMPSPAK